MQTLPYDQNRIRTTFTCKVLSHIGANLINLLLWPTVGSGTKINLKPALCGCLEEENMPPHLPSYIIWYRVACQRLRSQLPRPPELCGRESHDYVKTSQPLATWRTELTQSCDLGTWDHSNWMEVALIVAQQIKKLGWKAVIGLTNFKMAESCKVCYSIILGPLWCPFYIYGN